MEESFFNLAQAPKQTFKFSLKNKSPDLLSKLTKKSVYQQQGNRLDMTVNTNLDNSLLGVINKDLIADLKPKNLSSGRDINRVKLRQDIFKIS